MFQQAIINYVNRPDVFEKLAQKFPQAAVGVPSEIKVSSIEDAIYEVASSRYMQKKQAALISAGLKELGELQNG